MESRKKQQVMSSIVRKERWGSFQMPLHYPNYTRSEYEAMPEWQLNCLLLEYGLPLAGDVDYKRKFAIGAFLWSNIRHTS